MADAQLEAFGTAVYRARKEKGWTLEALAAEALGNPDRKGYCSQVEKGKRNLSEGTILNFGRALSLPDRITAPLLNRALPLDDETQTDDATTQRLLTDIEALRAELKLSEALAIALAYKYAEGNPTDIEGALKGLEAAFETAAKEKARDALPSNIDAAVDEVMAKVAALNDEGQIDDADALLEAEIEARAERIERERAAQTRLLERALEQAKLTNDPAAYARRTWLAIQVEKPDLGAQLQSLLDEFARLYNDGLRFGTPFALTAAAALCDELAARAPTPEARALATNNKAATLEKQGRRQPGEAGAALLSQAVAAYDAILKVYTRKHYPVHWATTQHNKGSALFHQGNRTAGDLGAALLSQGVVAYDAALGVRTRKDHPVAWAMTQNNKGAALFQQGIRTAGDAGAALLSQAVVAHDAALEVYTREDHPVAWAMTQNNRGNALTSQGTLTAGDAGAALLSQAVVAYDAALEVRTREDHPMDWAGTQNNKGNALKHQGIRMSGDAGGDILSKAVKAYDAALGIWTHEDHPVDWAQAQVNLAIAEEAWAGHDSNADPGPLLEEALAHVDRALTVYDPKHMSYDHDNATSLRARIEARLAALQS